MTYIQRWDKNPGGVGVDALLVYGLSAKDLDVKAGALYEAVKRFDDEYRPGLLALLDKIDGLIGDVLEDLL